MSLKNKAMALGLSAAMLLSPAASLAESNYAAGELTTHRDLRQLCGGQSAESQRRFQP